MKYEWRKNDKELYLPNDKPQGLTVPRFKFFMISGEGNPNSEAFGIAIEALYALSYGVKMLPKKGITPEGYFDYTVFPLEGVWDLSEAGRKKAVLDKDELVYTIMIRQPDFVTDRLALEVLEAIKAKKLQPMLEKAEFGEISEGLCVQIMHNGSFDSEPQSFAVMDKFCEENGLIRTEHKHREIYISDARKTEPDKQRTVLRYQVK